MNASTQGNNTVCSKTYPLQAVHWDVCRELLKQKIRDPFLLTSLLVIVIIILLSALGSTKGMKMERGKPTSFVKDGRLSMSLGGMWPTLSEALRVGKRQERWAVWSAGQAVIQPRHSCTGCWAQALSGDHYKTRLPPSVGVTRQIHIKGELQSVTFFLWVPNIPSPKTGRVCSF